MTESRELQLIEGTVSSLIYQNEENGYTILRLDLGEEELTVVGPMPGVSPGEYLSIRGSWVRHPTYGRQFKAEIVERRLPQGLKEVFHYLASGAVKGVGKATARALIEEFGEDALTIIGEHPEELTKIRGISPKRAMSISASFQQQMGMRLLVEFLGQHNLPMELAAPLYRSYGGAALEALKNDPYLLVGEGFGVEFSLADQLALDLGLSGDDPLRLEAGLIFKLTHNLNNGHTFLPRGKLLAASGQLLDIPTEELEEAMERLALKGQVVEDRVAGEDAVYLPDLYEAELLVTQRVREMQDSDLLPPERLNDVIDRIQRQQGIRYAPQQRQAVELAARNQMMLLTGGPGTGKSATRFCVK